LEEGTLTLLLPSSAAPEDPARSVLPNVFTAVLVYRLTITGPGGSRTLDSGGGGTTLTLGAGTWTVQARAYDPGDLSSPIGSGNAAVTVIAGRNSFVKVPMQVDPIYEAGLDDIYLHSEGDLRRIGAAVNGLDISDPNRTFYLENDIVLTQPWTPIGDNTTPFKAKFDGQGHSITIRSFSGPILDGNAAYLGFFAFVDNTTIKDTTIKYELGVAVDMRTGSPATFVAGNAGGVAGYVSNTALTNIRVEGNFSVVFDGNDGFGVGGIVGIADDGVTITGCHVAAALGGTLTSTSTAHYLYIGGIAGLIDASSSGAITLCSFTGTIDGHSLSYGNAGGIVGFMYNVEILACSAEGRFMMEAFTPMAGGIIGVMDGVSSRIDKSYAAGVIEVVETTTATYPESDAGGIAGRLEGGIIDNCYARVNIYARGSSVTNMTCVGGIAGVIYDDTVISTSYALGRIISDPSYGGDRLGGIAGFYVASGGTVGATIQNCLALNDGLESDSSPNVRGILGMHESSLLGTITDNYAASDIDFDRDSSYTPDPSLDGDTSKSRGQFEGQTNQGSYLFTAWFFPGNWEWIDGYPYPVLNWQDSPPPDPATL
jgi:hypothetical protein